MNNNQVKTLERQIPSAESVMDCIITGIADQQNIAPETIRKTNTLASYGFCDEYDVMELSLHVEDRFGISFVPNRMNFILGGINPDLIHTKTIDRISKHVQLAIKVTFEKA